MSRSKTRDIAANELRIIEDGIIDSDAIADGTFTTDTAFANSTISLAKLTDDAKEFKPINLTFDSAQTLDLSQGNFFNAGNTNGTNTTLSFTNVPAAGKWSYIVKHDSDTQITRIISGNTNVSDWTWDSSNTKVANLTIINGDSGSFITESLHDSGTKLFASSNISGLITRFDLSTPYDLSTASRAQIWAHGQSGTLRGTFIKPDGTELYTSHYGAGTIYQWTMSTPYDMSTISTYTTQQDPAQIDTDIYMIDMNDSGNKLFAQDYDTATIYEYNLSTPWDLSSYSYSGNSLNVTSNLVATTRIGGFCLNKEGTKLFINGNGIQIGQYNLSTPFDLSTASYSSADSAQFGGGVGAIIPPLSADPSVYPRSIKITQDEPRYLVVNEYPQRVFLLNIEDSSTTITGTPLSSVTLPASVKNAVTNTPDSNNPRQYIEFITYDSGTNIYINNDKTFST